MNASITVDFGNIWDALSAIGTVSATIIALWLAFDGRKKKLSASFIWAGVEEYQAKLLVSNPSSKIIVINTISLKYQYKMYPAVDLLTDFHYKDLYTLLPNEAKEIPIRMPTGLHDNLHIKEMKHKDGITLDNAYLKQSGKKRRLAILITDNCGKKYRIVQKYSVSDLLSLFFGEALFRK